MESEEYPELRIEYSTVHKTKGLEADNTIIINMVIIGWVSPTKWLV